MSNNVVITNSCSDPAVTLEVSDPPGAGIWITQGNSGDLHHTGSVEPIIIKPSPVVGGSFRYTISYTINATLENNSFSIVIPNLSAFGLPNLEPEQDTTDTVNVTIGDEQG